jgi:hypothetical protein
VYVQIKVLVSLFVVLSLLYMVYSTSIRSPIPPIYSVGSTGLDMSWPEGNCNAPAKLLKTWAIIGTNDGLDFRGNPCLKAEASRFKNISLYANTGISSSANRHVYAEYPKKCTKKDNNCLAYNYGYNAGKYAVIYSSSMGIHASFWWLDVETDNSWSTNISYNRSSIQGEVDAIKDYTLVAKVGIYSYPGQWDTITGNWRTGMPDWVATGTSDRRTAISFCNGKSFTGGPTLLTQYTLTLDHDFVCRDF